MPETTSSTRAPVHSLRSGHAPAPAPGERPRLRVGVFADGPLQPRWLAGALAKAAALDGIEIVALAEGSHEGASLPWLWRLYSWLDRRLFGSSPDTAGVLVLHTVLPRAQRLPLPPAGDAAGVAAWRATIATLRLDVAFALGEMDDALLEGLARYGVWRYRYGEDAHRSEALAGAREVLEGAPATTCVLSARAGPEPLEKVIYQSWSRTLPYSVASSRANLLRKAAEFAPRALAELHRSGDAWFARCAPLASDRPQSAARRPGAGERSLVRPRVLASGLARLGTRIASRGMQKLLYVDQWIIGYRFGAEGWPTDLKHYHRLLPPPDRYWADPFPFERAGRHYIFFEEFMFATAKAHIVAVEVGRDGRCSAPVRVLERPYHLSYPFLIEHGGELYMIPESGANRTVEVYRCTRFPDEWRLEKVLLSGAPFVDATIHRTGNAWWMFVNAGAEGTELHDELHLYWADSLLGEWRPHARNPVKSDVRSARPAGRLYQRDGVLYRPAQICAPLYGSGISINRVLRLTPDDYLEREERRLLPSDPARVLGLHTMNRAGELSVIDAFMRRPRRGEPRAEPERLVPLNRTITEHGDN